MTGSKSVTVAFIMALVAVATPSAAAAQPPCCPFPVRHSGDSRADPEAAEMSETAATGPWTDRLRAGAVSIRAIHFLELRTRIAALRDRAGVPLFEWTDPVLTPGVTLVKSVHLTELRAALDAVYDAAGRPRPTYTDAAVTAGVSVVRGAHVTELREAVEVVASPSPSLDSFYAHLLPFNVVDPTYPSHNIFAASADLDGDGNGDLIILGADYPTDGVSSYRPQPGRVYLGDGDGGFTRAPSALFPTDTLNTVQAAKVLFGDLNGDGRLDMFVAASGWDAEPFPGEQNRLYLSRPGGGWRDATTGLPQLSDFSHSAAIGDIRGGGAIDIVVGNGYLPRILAYALLNDGDGSFLVDRTILPVGPGETMDSRTGHLFPGTVLTDLDDDGRPELIVTADANDPLNRNRHSTVFWNRSGAFSERDKTVLPIAAPFVDSHIDLDAASIDADGDGRLDLLVVGTQGRPSYDGWFVQLLMNRGDRRFIDETSRRLQPHERFGGIVGEGIGAPWPQRVEVLDFDGDGAPDFAVQSGPGGGQLPQSQPLIWLNDGSGQFTALKVHDFVRPGEEWLLKGARLMQTRHGYSFIAPQTNPGSGGLIVTGLLATRPYP